MYAGELLVLLLEDSDSDAWLFQEALRKNSSSARVLVIGDGDRGLNYLFQRGNYAAAPRPDVVVLDINLPKRNGHDVLRAIRQDAGLKSLPVIVFSSSAEHDDIAKAALWGAQAYWTKPSDLDEYFQTIQQMELFWRNLNQSARVQGQSA